MPSAIESDRTNLGYVRFLDNVNGGPGTRSARSPPREGMGYQDFSPKGIRGERTPTLRKLHPAGSALLWRPLANVLSIDCSTINHNSQTHLKKNGLRINNGMRGLL